MTLSEIKSQVKCLDEALSPDDEEFKAAVILLAGTEVKQTIKEIRQFTHYRQSFVVKVVGNLKRNGIFVKGKIHHGGWFDKKDGGIAFWLDVCVGLGLMKRV